MHATSEQKHSHGFNVQTKIEPSNLSHVISAALIELFDEHYTDGMVRNLGVSVGNYSRRVMSN